MRHPLRAVGRLFWLLCTVLLWQTAHAQDPAGPIPQVISDAPDLVSAGVATYSMINSTIYWADQCPPEGGPGPVSINRISAAGGTPRRLFEIAGCVPGAIASNPIADATHVYWISSVGVMRLSRNANVGDAPEVLNAFVRAPPKVPSALVRRMQVLQTREFVFALTEEGVNRVLYRISKTDGSAIAVLTSTDFIRDVSVDEEGSFYYRLTQAPIPVTPGRLLQGDYRNPLTQHALLAVDVTAYYVDQAFFDPAGCAPLDTRCHETEIFIGQGNRIERFVPRTQARTIEYVSPIADSVVHWIGGTTRQGLFTTLYFFERRLVENEPLVPHFEFLLTAHPLRLSSGEPRILHRIIVLSGTFLNVWPQELLINGQFLYWQFNGRLQQLPANAAALPRQNLLITDVEVTQGLQYRDNRLSLIANRRTFVRVHVKADSSDATDIRAELFSDRSPQPLVPVNRDGAGNPLVGLTVPLTPARADLNQSFLFELPADWLNGTLRLTARLNLAIPPRLPIEPRLDDNTRTVEVQFKPSPYLPVVFFPISYVAGLHQEPGPDDLPRLMSQVRRMFPLADTVNPAQTRQGLDADVRPTVELQEFAAYMLQLAEECLEISVDRRSECPTGYLQAWLRRQRLQNEGVGSSGSTEPLFYAAPAPAPGFWMRGQARPSRRQAVGPSNEPETAAHELAHLGGRDHPTLCGVTEDDGAFDPGFPYPHPAPLGPDPLTLTPPEDATNGGVMGLDLGDPALGIPMTTKPWNAHSELMSYCNNTSPFNPYWISDYTYTGLYDNMLTGFANTNLASLTPSAAGPQSGDFLLIEGAIVGDGSRAIVYQAARTESVFSVPPRVPGPYSIELRNAQNVVLAAYPFTPEQHADQQVSPKPLLPRLCSASARSCHSSPARRSSGSCGSSISGSSSGYRSAPIRPWSETSPCKARRPQ
jgi:hypothetical protein